MRLFRRMIVIAGIFLSLVSAAAAQGFLFDTAALPPEAVRQLTDEQLNDAFVAVMIDIEAGTVFGEAAGFNKTDFDHYKELLRYRYALMKEFERRKLTYPQVKPGP